MLKLYECSNVLTRTGLKKVCDLNIFDEIYNGIGFVNIKNISESFQEECNLVKNEYGYDAIFTKDSKLNVMYNRKVDHVVLNDIKIDDCVCMTIGQDYQKDLVDLNYYQYEKKTFSNKSNRLNENITFPNKLDSELAYFLGYAYGDGYVECDKFNEECSLSLACSDDHPVIKDKLKNIVKKLFNYDIKVRKGDGRLEDYRMHNKIILYNLKNNEILKQKAGSLIFPEKILNSSTEIQFAFISGFFDADGCAQKSKKSFSIEIIDEIFLKQIQSILNANGCVSRFSYKLNKCENCRLCSRLYLVGSGSIYKFVSLMKESVKIQQTNVLNTRDTVLTIYDSYMLNVKYINHRFINNKDFISYNNFKKLCNFYDLSNFEILLQSKIVKNEYIGNLDCYSIDVDAKGIWVDGYFCLVS